MARSKWISCKKELPPLSQQVLGFCPIWEQCKVCTLIAVGDDMEQDWVDVYDNLMEPEFNPSHWMWLPNGPK